MTTRPLLHHIIMNFALSISLRSTCARMNVGAVITSLDLSQIYSYGYNGVAKGLFNNCLSNEAGNCGCIHAEQNALIKQRNKESSILFCSHQPCPKCQMLILNSNVSLVYYKSIYREPLQDWFLKSHVKAFCINDLTPEIFLFHHFELKNGRKI